MCPGRQAAVANRQFAEKMIGYDTHLAEFLFLRRFMKRTLPEFLLSPSLGNKGPYRKLFFCCHCLSSTPPSSACHPPANWKSPAQSCLLLLRMLLFLFFSFLLSLSLCTGTYVSIVKRKKEGMEGKTKMGQLKNKRMSSQTKEQIKQSDKRTNEQPSRQLEKRINERRAIKEKIKRTNNSQSERMNPRIKEKVGL